MVAVTQNKFIMKANDTRPVMEYTCANPDGTPVDVTGATPTFKMRDSAGAAVSLAGAAALGASPASGAVQYTFVAADTATAGTYQGEFEIDFGGGAIETFPKGFITVTIVDDV